jgi:chemotaxis methyl-accepting protein methylase
MVDFKKHNFIKDPPLAVVDLIFCRNVIIYLTGDMKSVLIEKFYNSLLPDGILIIGKTELLLSNRDARLFYIFDQKEHMYKKERRHLVQEDPFPTEKEKRKKFFR